MANAVLQLNDLNLVWQSEDGLLANAIGVAHVSDQGIVFGSDAWGKLWLEPQHCYTQYWQQFNQNSLIPAKPGMRHNADLVFHQLQQLKEARHLLQLENPSDTDNQLLIIPPSHFRKNELELLLAVGQSLELPISSFIDPAVAAVATSLAVEPSSINRALYIDMQLHQTLLIEVICQRGRWVKGAVTPLGDCGLLQLLNTSAHFLANLFINEHRFDPLKLGATSQFLYELVFNELLFAGGDFPLEIESKDGRLNCTITATDWRKMLSLRLRSLLGTIKEQLDDNSIVCLHENSRWLDHHLDESVAYVNVNDKEIGRFLFQYWSSINTNELVHIDSLERQESSNHSYSVNEDSISDAANSKLASHLLFDDKAYPLQNGLWLVIEDGSLHIHSHPVSNPILIVKIEQQTLQATWGLQKEGEQSEAVQNTELKRPVLTAENGEIFVVHGQQLKFISVLTPSQNVQSVETCSSASVF